LELWGQLGKTPHLDAVPARRSQEAGRRQDLVV